MHSDLGRVLDHGAIINASSESASRNLNYESFAEVNEVEEKELAQSKRHSKDSNHIASSLNAQPAFSFQANITRLFLDRHLSIVSSFGSRYIQFCDFRI